MRGEQPQSPNIDRPRSPDAVFLLVDGVLDGVTQEGEDAEEHQEGAVEREEQNGERRELEVWPLAKHEHVEDDDL